MGEFFQETIEEHRRTFNRNEIRDILDTYLLQIEKAREEGTGHCLFEGKDHGKFRFTENFDYNFKMFGF